MRIALCAASVALLALLARPAAAQRVGIRAEIGIVHMHDAGGAAAGFHVSNLVGSSGATRLDFGVIGDSFSVAVDGGLAYRVPISRRWTAVLRGGGGFMVEGPDWAGLFLRVGSGVAWGYSPNGSVALIFDAGVHDGFAGPSRLMLGWERRFGRRQPTGYRR